MPNFTPVPMRQLSFFVGSANCSESAFSGNVEFMLQLRYRKHGFGSALVGRLFSKDEGQSFEQIKELPEVDAPIPLLLICWKSH